MYLVIQATLNIGGNIINAQAIEHFILRKPASSSMKEVNLTKPIFYPSHTNMYISCKISREVISRRFLAKVKRMMIRKALFVNFLDLNQWIQISYLLCAVELVHLQL